MSRWSFTRPRGGSVRVERLYAFRRDALKARLTRAATVARRSFAARGPTRVINVQLVMTSVGGTTTVTEAASAARASSDEAALIWLFPGAAPPVDLRPRPRPRADDRARRDLGRLPRRQRRLAPPRGPARRSGGGRSASPTSGAATGFGSTAARSPRRRSASGDVVRLGGWVGVVAGGAGAFVEIAPGLWGGAALEAALAPLRQAAASDLPIVLEGETGTGKEVVTRALHGWSGRPGPLVAVNCAALPEGLAEGELFGYRRGAFTGADRASAGFFRGADRRDVAARRGLGPAAAAAGQALARARGARGAAARRDSPGAD